MANTVSSLVVSLGLNAAEFVTGFTKAEREAQRSTQNIRRQIESIESGVVRAAAKIGAGIAAGLTVTAFADMVRGAFDAQEELSNLGKRAGISGAELSSLSNAAKLSQTSLDDVANMSAKVSKELLEFGKQGSKSTAVLTALGVSAKDVPGLLAKPAEAVFKLAKLLDQLPESGTKAGAQLLLLGKSGGTTSAFMAELATQTELVKKRTDEEIEAAKAFNDRLTVMGIKADDLRTKFANALLPTLDAIVTAFNNLTSAGGGTADTLERLKNDGDIQEWARNGALAVAILAESLIFVGRVAKSVTSSFRVVAADIEAELARTNAPSQKPFGSLGFTPEEAAKGEADYIAASERARKIKNDADQNYVDLWEKNAAFISDAIKKSFEMQDRVTQAGIDAVANSDRNDRLNASNNVKSAAAAAKAAAAKVKAVQAAINAANATSGGDDAARRILDGQIKALEASIARERDILNARQDFLRDYYQDGRISLAQYYDQLQAARDANLQSTLTALNKEIALAEAAKAKAAKASDKAGFQNTADAARERQTTLIAQSRFSEEALSRERTRAAEQYGFQLNELNAKMLELAGNTAAAAAIRFDDQNAVFRRGLQSSGNTGALAQLQAIKDQLQIQASLNDKNKEFAMVLDQVGIAQERLNIAQQSGSIGEIEFLVQTSALNKSRLVELKRIAQAYAEIAAKSKDPADLIKAQQMQVAVERLAAQTDLLGDKFKDVFSSSLVDPMTDFVTGVKSAKDAFKAFTDDLTRQLARIAAQGIAQNLANSVFGGSGSSGPDFMSVLAKMAMSFFGGSAGGLTSTGGGFGEHFAMGGISRGGFAMVGERGPEMVSLPRGAQVTPNDKLGKLGNVVNIHQNINVMPGANTASARQAAGRLRDATLGAVRDR